MIYPIADSIYWATVDSHYLYNFCVIDHPTDDGFVNPKQWNEY